ncbi:hypothetical protein KFU94_10115 [Chloroflexi bacterium TSY]|nr:hypothetical protein [Chloroflexi bacterium TSY]
MGTWMEYSANFGDLGSIIYFVDDLPDEITPNGDYLAWLGGDDLEVAELSQQAMLPNKEPIVLSFAYQILSEDECGYDFVLMMIDHEPLHTFDLCADAATNDWTIQAVDLSTYAGQLATLRFYIETDDVTASNFFLDDVGIQVNTPAPTPEPTQPPTMGNTLENGTFDAGADGHWTEESSNFGGQGALILNERELPEEISPLSGAYAAWLGGANDEESSLTQSVIVPNSSTPTLVIHYQIHSEDVCGYDYAEIQVDGQVLDSIDLCEDKATQTWTQTNADLSDHAGQTISLGFLVGTDGSFVSDFFLDDILIIADSTDVPPVETGRSTNALMLEAVSGLEGVLLDWSAPSDVNVTQYRVLRRMDQDFTDIATVVATEYSDNTHNEMAMVSGRNCYKIEGLNENAQTLVDSNTACTAAGLLELWTPSLVGTPNDTIAVPINVENAGGIQITNSDIWLDYDPDVLDFVDVEGTEFASGYRWLVLDAIPGRLQITATPNNPLDPIPLFGSGSLLRLTFDIIGENGARTPLELVEYVESLAGSTMTALDEAGETFDVSLVIDSGVLEVGDQSIYTLGDVNGDGMISQADLEHTIQLTTSANGESNRERKAGDLTGDGGVNSGDGAVLAYLVENGVLPDGSSAQGTLLNVRESNQSQATVTLSLSNVSGAAGTTVVSTLQAQGLQQLSGADIEIVYDSDVVDSVAAQTNGLTSNFTLGATDSGMGKLRIALADDVAINGDGTLLTLSLKLANDASGSTPLRISDAALYDQVGRHFTRDFTGNRIDRIDATIAVDGEVMQSIFLPFVTR